MNDICTPCLTASQGKVAIAILHYIIANLGSDFDLVMLTPPRISFHILRRHFEMEIIEAMVAGLEAQGFVNKTVFHDFDVVPEDFIDSVYISGFGAFYFAETGIIPRLFQHLIGDAEPPHIDFPQFGPSSEYDDRTRAHISQMRDEVLDRIEADFKQWRRTQWKTPPHLRRADRVAVSCHDRETDAGAGRR